KKRRLIELLKEQKAILINRAVTRGLNPDAPMKDSGVPWIGEIPAHWEVKRLKHLLDSPLKYGANEEAEDYVEGEPRYIRITDFGRYGNLRDETITTLPWKKARDYMLQDGDILFARSGATVGKSFLFAAKFQACFAGYLIQARTNPKKIRSEYLYLYTKSTCFEHWKEETFSKATIQNIGADKYAVLPVVLPTVDEQSELLSYFSSITEPCDQTVEVVTSKISKLNEFKQTLIANAVTGKIKV
ncbi:MAG: restriction endonuclease subunit S, partial [Aestuariivita sp.]|nr:restriction endonuclease subunit S [Aestuariivita sp.]